MIKELTENGGYNVGSIPLTVDDVWHEVFSVSKEQSYKINGYDVRNEQNTEHHSIDHLVDEANKGEHWRYFVSQTLRIALNLICEDVPDTVAGIILPLRRTKKAVNELEPQNLAELGECLICWRDQSHTFHTFYDTKPYFDYPSDFRIRGLRAVEEEEPEDSTFVVLQRKVVELLLPINTVETIRHLLILMHENINMWLPYFKRETHGTVYPTAALGNTSNVESTLKFLTNMVVRIGGKNDEKKDHWKFCCVLLPDNSLLPFQQRNLFVQAQSTNAPHVIDRTVVTPEDTILSLSLRAFQSGHVVYRAHVSIEDKTIVYREQESPVQSVIAFPIGSENGAPIGILYIVSEEKDAFSVGQQRVLRLITRMAEELLAVMSIRQRSEEGLRDIVKKPRVVNKMLSGFPSENRFIQDVESLLTQIRMTNSDSLKKGETSFISIDMDNQSSYTSRYGDQLSINLSRELGERIRNQMSVLLGKQTDYKIYHIYADRFFLLLNNRTLDNAREYAEKLQEVLQRTYFISIMPLSYKQPVRDKIEIKDVTVRLGVTSYKHTKLHEVLGRYPVETQIADMGFSIFYFLEEALNIARQEGRGRIVSWFPADSAHEHGSLAVWPQKE